MSDQAKDKKTEFLTARQLAEVLQISESTVHKLRRAGTIPAVVLTPRLIRYNLRDVKGALRSHTAEPTQDTEPESRLEPDPQLSFEEFESMFVDLTKET